MKNNSFNFILVIVAVMTIATLLALLYISKNGLVTLNPELNNVLTWCFKTEITAMVGLLSVWFWFHRNDNS